MALAILLLIVCNLAVAGYNPNNPNGQATMANSQPVVIASNQSAIPVTGSFSFSLPAGASTSALQTAGNSTLSSILSAVTGTLDISASSLPLPTGAAISSRQPILGSALTAASMPVNIASDQTVPVSIAGTVNVTGGLTNAQLRASDVPVSIATMPTTPVTGTFWQLTQPVSVATLPLPAGAATSALQSSGASVLSNIDGKTPALGQANMVNSSPVVIATNQSPVAVSLPAGASTSALQTAGNNLLATIYSLQQTTASYMTSLGQKLMAGSTPVTIASDQSAIPVTGTFWQATQPVSVATLPLPAGAATSALQGTGNTSLGSIDTKLPSQYNSGVPVTVLVDTTTHTYSAAYVFSAATTPTDIFTINGSASKTIVIRHISVTGVQTTASDVLFNIIRRSTANTGGTSTTVTSTPVSSAFPAASAVVKAYTANPTLGTLVGLIQSDYVFLPDAASNKGGDALGFHGFEGSPIAILNGTAEQLSINMNSVTVSGNVLACHIVWSEF